MLDPEKAITIEGTIMMVLPGTMFRVALANNHLVLAHISGKMRKRFIRLTIGDRVRLEMSPYDTNKARIVYRLPLMRYYFDKPRARKSVSLIKRILVRCPATAKLAATGRTTEEKRWAASKLETQKFTCPHCR